METKKVSAVPFAVIAVLVGVLTPLLFAIAAGQDGFWTFNVNTLSDLGVSYDSLAANIFNYICIIGGILIVIVGLGKLFIRNGLDSASGFFLAMGAVFLVGVGIFTKDYDCTHVAIAYVYFLLMLIAVIISMVSDALHGRMITAAITAILLVVVIASVPGFATAGVEVISAVCMCVWLVAQGMSLAFSKN